MPDRPISGVLILSLSAVLAACSSSGSAPGAKGPATPASASPSASSSVSAGPQAEADRAGLQRSDLPGDVWQSQPPSPDPHQAADDRTFDACLHVPDIDHVRTAVARADFQRTDHLISVNSEVNVVAPAMATRDVAALSSAAGEQCQLDSAHRAAAANNANGQPTHLQVTGISRRQVSGMGVVDRVRLIASPAGGGRPTPVTIDQVTFASGSLIVQLGFTGIGEVPPSALERHVVAAVKQRITG
jgi:hypothetical protein